MSSPVGPSGSQGLLAVLLQEVGVALAESEDPVGRRAVVVDAFRLGGELERVAGGLLVEAVDGREAEELLGVRLGRAGQGWQLRQAGAGEGERQLALGDLLQGGDQRLELGPVEELDLVEQEDDPVKGAIIRVPSQAAAL
jgi:hypothetical protein